MTIHLGGPAQSCEAVCGAAGSLRCSAKHLSLLNSCDQLRLYTACEAGCTQDTTGAWLPAYVTANAPKASRPALCLVQLGEVTPTCGEASSHMQRLCPCMKET